ncbi:hypothetical protein PPL_08540 [Heterostelium album PN500]|uniref:Tc1-like transposase DDE domain-containing protein n=1 Tax=Heterostelium pallidum (strain ATCC 26659 / Pp 5 / PN500) TaxID=670386 RepID=D3BIH0_HETP5|nr:hypothetical protein PPL_08540 [Heterostelium album PN500]EFA79070.1 hypothetical protein PPL_08540 [Heterostelium album PN500]|eukprot:XP_020431193.1 hypothetical protein PPL_08540 [Heterostelium album PN500]
MVFMDEVHFNSKDLRKRSVLGPKSQRVHVSTDSSLSFSFSLTVAIRFDGSIFVSPQRSTNDQYNCLDYITAAIESDFLKEGDVLIMDNATVHLGDDTHPIIVERLTNAGVDIRFLPAYSPELNPIELVFGYVKNYVRHHRTLQESNLTIVFLC